MRRLATAVLLSGMLAVGGALASLTTAPAGAIPNPPTPPALVTASTWSLGTIPSPNALQLVQLASVTCASASFCVAVGNQPGTGGSNTNTLIEQWNGSSWSIVTSPNPAGAGESQLYGVSCAGPSFCAAVGVSGPGTTFVNPLVEHWNGKSWSIVTAVNPTGSPATQLSQVSCLSSTWCTAVGRSENTLNNRVALVEMWNGTSWTTVDDDPAHRRHHLPTE